MAERSYVSGVAWSGLNAVAGVLLPLLIFIFFARVLPPAQVGAVALAVAWSEILKGAGLPGLYEALLQPGADDERHHETALVLLLSSGAVLFLVYLGIIAWAAPWSEAPEANFALLAIIGLRIPFDLATLQPQARLARSLEYRRLATRSLYANLLAGGAGIALAVSGRPLLGLVVYQVGQVFLVFLSTALGRGTLARLRYHRNSARAMRREAGFATANRFIAGAVNYLDQVAVAAVLDAERLAYFNVAKRAEMALVTAAVSFNSILFQPLFARSVASGEGRAEGLARALLVLTMLCGLPTVIFAVNSGTIVPAVFGAQWTEAAVPAAALAVGGFARALGFAHIGLLSVSERNHVILAATTASALAGAAVVLAGAPLGLGWIAVFIAFKNMVVTAWLAVATRADSPHLVRLYLWEVITPVVLMVAGAAAGRWLGESVTGGSANIASTILVWAISAAAVAAVAGGYFGRKLVGLARALRRPAEAQAV